MDQISGKPAIRFLSFENDEEDAEAKAKLKEAAERIEKAIAREKSLSELIEFQPPTQDEVTDLENDTRPLYERLLEQKNKKQEAIDESNKLSNLVTKLDEDDVNYLNDVARVKQEEEIKKRLEIFDALEERKRMSEKRILEDEQKMKDILTGSRTTDRGSTSSLKSKFSSLIKVKPKAKIQMNKSSEQMIQNPPQSKNESEGQSKRGLSSEDVATEKQLTTSEEGVKKQNDECKRKKMDKSERDSTWLETRDGNQSTNRVDKQECVCKPKDVMNCIGILPSMPQVSNYRDSSDESDSSANNLDVRIVPRLGKRRHR